MADVVTTLATVKAVSEHFDEAARLAEWVQKQKWYGRLRDILRAKHNFLFLGPTGVGKSNLIESLRSNVPVDIDRAIRTLDSTTKTLKVDDTVFNLVDVPGDIGKADIRLDVIRRKYSGAVTAVVNVAAYGYHEHAGGTRRDAVTLKNTAKFQWLKDHQREELNATREWVREFAHLRSAKGLITVVTKADLWRADQDEVLDYYRGSAGEYHKELGAARTLPHTVVPYCSIIKKFYDDCPHSGLFDDMDRARVRYELIREFLTVAARD
ncbi:MAG: 50S ribosome-binding GTPase [Gemmataceae bacterium]|nr:50S ribosome-binding GTPase [Gemmataceae bacterium]